MDNIYTNPNDKELHRYSWRVAIGCYLERCKNTKKKRFIELGILPYQWFGWAVKMNFEFRPALGLVKLTRRANG